MSKTLIIVGHEEFENSNVNKFLLEKIQAHFTHDTQEITIHHLFSHYQDYQMDILYEQELLMQHDNIVLQFPLQWFSMPAILKKWMDSVFTYGFAFGKTYQFAGKKLQIVVTVGGAEAAYSLTGNNRFTLDQILVPIEATAHYLQMHYQPPLNLYQTYSLSQDRLDEFSNTYINRLKSFNY